MTGPITCFNPSARPAENVGRQTANAARLGAQPRSYLVEAGEGGALGRGLKADRLLLLAGLAGMQQCWWGAAVGGTGGTRDWAGGRGDAGRPELNLGGPG